MRLSAPRLGRALLRNRIDGLDRRIIRLLAARQRLTDAMAAFKTADAVRDEQRIAAVLSHVRNQAEMLDLCPDLIEGMWRRLMEVSARRQERRLRGARRHALRRSPCG